MFSASDVLSPWRTPSLVLPKAARFDAVSASSILEATESELPRGLPPFRVREFDISSEPPVLRVEGVVLTDLARAGVGCPGTWEEKCPAGTEDAEGC